MEHRIQPSAEKRLVWRNRLLLLALWLVVYGSVTLFAPPLLDDADSVHAEVAREMLLRHDWITLYANGIRYLEKAPLFYWLMALSMKLLGVSAAAARVPLSLAVAALTLLLERFARRLYSVRAGLYAGLVTLSGFGIFIFSRISIPDVLVCVWLALALYAYCMTSRQRRAPSIPVSSETVGPPETSVTLRRWCWLFAAACALDVLTKGLIGIVFPVAIVALHLLLTRGWRGALARVRGFHPFSSALVFAVIAVPWHVLAGLANPSQGSPGGVVFTHGHFSVPLPADGHVHGWTWFYFINEQVLRYLNLRVPRDYDTVPLWLFLGLIFIWLMPWSAFLPAAFQRALPVSDRAYRNRLRMHCLTVVEQSNLLLVLWAVLPLLFFSLSTRQEYYVLPALPAMILLMAAVLDQPANYRRLQHAAAALGAFGLLAAAVCLYFLLHSRAPLPGTDLSTLLQQNPGDYALSFGHFLDLNARAMGMFRLPLALTAAALGLGLPVAYWLRRRQLLPQSIYATAAAATLFLFAAWLGLRTFSPTLTSAQLADALRPQLKPADMLAIHGEYESGSSLGFYLRRRDLHIVEGRSSNLWYGSFFTDAPNIFETPQSLEQKWAGPQRIFLWEDPHDTERPVLHFTTPAYVIAEAGGKRILSNRQGEP